MVFSDTSNQAGLIQECEDLTGLGVAGISGNANQLDKFVRRMNKWNDKVQTMILSVQDEWDYDDSNHTDFPIMTADLAASQQDYALPATGLQIKRVEITYDNSSWYRVEPMDINEYGKATSQSTNITGDFSKDAPYYDIQYNSIFLYPVPDAAVTNGLKIWVSREVTTFADTDTTKEPGFDRQFHEILALGASYDYCKEKGLPQTEVLKRDLIEMEDRLRKYYSDKQVDRVMSMKANYINYE